MITISLCMIVKNEEKLLARCLDSVADIMDEIIIVDTGSADRTKEIAARYTDKIYDFVWINDFAAARNFAFSMASMEYIYSADADEVLDEENRELFLRLKENLLPEIDIVQMYYANQLDFGTIYNFDKELRPKLFKRVRSFVWKEPIHEQVILDPVIYDSDVVILHLPDGSHKNRDLAAFVRITAAGGRLSKRLHNIYARELFISGEEQDFLTASSFFEASCADTERSLDEIKEAACVVARAARIGRDTEKFFKYALKVIASDGCSEICCELGAYFLERRDLEEAIVWFYNAVYETESILNIHSSGDIPLRGLSECYRLAGNEEQAEAYGKLAAESAGKETIG
ncbi:MAG: glycosyltransferase family 2 protein [Blautia sp.]|nr:glycosyltransferase family 2 protein [Blautia sp.]MCM1199666.1 glycosyltransferase family 2 protein [Bacteroides fragilis]